MQVEILALRHQLAVYQRTCARPRLRPADRVLWAWLSRAWSDWRGALVIFKPETVIAWRRRRFREYWTKLSRSRKPGRPTVAREVPRFLLRDRDHIYGEYFSHRVKRMGIEEAVISPRSPWQNPLVERLVGSIRRECLDHVIVFNERQLKRILTCYFDYLSLTATSVR